MIKDEPKSEDNFHLEQEPKKMKDDPKFENNPEPEDNPEPKNDPEIKDEPKSEDGSGSKDRPEESEKDLHSSPATPAQEQCIAELAARVSSKIDTSCLTFIEAIRLGVDKSGPFRIPPEFWSTGDDLYTYNQSALPIFPCRQVRCCILLSLRIKEVGSICYDHATRD